MIGSRRTLLSPSRAVIVLIAVLAACSSSNIATTPTAKSASDPNTTISADEVRPAPADVAGCWYLDPGVDPASVPVVEIHVELLPDGSVQSAEIVDAPRMATDANFRATAQAALRAILKCSPLNLPRDKYQTWKSTTFRFVP
jgi:hypothetical protein